jgi:hypothetical protein
MADDFGAISRLATKLGDIVHQYFALKLCTVKAVKLRT